VASEFLNLDRQLFSLLLQPSFLRVDLLEGVETAMDDLIEFDERPRHCVHIGSGVLVLAQTAGDYDVAVIEAGLGFVVERSVAESAE